MWPTDVSCISSFVDGDEDDVAPLTEADKEAL
jgi:hypothetical protein